MKKRYKVRVNRAGIIFVGITIFLGVAAVNTANNLLFLVVSSMLSFMLVSGALSLYNLKGLDIRVIPPLEVYAGRRESFRVIVENQKIFPSFLITLSSQVDEKTIPMVSKRSEILLDFFFENRGYYENLELTIETSFPVGLFERFYIEKVPVRVIVFPKPIPASLKLLENNKASKSEGDIKTTSKGYEEIHSIREYSGEPLKLIHWKVSAKMGKLYVKDTYTQEKTPIILSLDLVEGDKEERISKLAYLVIKLIREGYPVGLKIGDEIIKPEAGEAQKRELLSTLSLI